MTPDPRDGDPLRAPDPDPLPVAGHQGCARWWLLWLAVGVAMWIIGGIVVVKLVDGSQPAIHRGVASHMGNAAVGRSYLALPIGPGHHVRLCGAFGCLHLDSTDAGPDKAMQRRGRIADLSVELFEMLSGRPASRGLAPVSWKGMDGVPAVETPRHPDDLRMMLEVRGDELYRP